MAVTIQSRANILARITGTTYYLDIEAAGGGDGSIATPWNTLTAALAGITSGDGLIISAGSYGDFIKTTGWWTADTVFIAAEGEVPVFSRIDFTSSSTIKSANAIFYGIKVLPDEVSQTEDPQDPASTLSTYNKTDIPVNLYYVGDFEIYQSEIVGFNKHLTTNGFYLSSSQNIIIERCHIHTIGSAITYINTDNIQIDYNYVHNVCGSHFKDGGNNGVTLIEGNHAHDANWNYAEDWCPRAEGQTYHGSIVVIAGSNITVRNNVLHDGGITGGIYFYGGNPRSNILIENNVLFDVHNNMALVVNDSAENIVIRNNTIICRGRYGYTQFYKYYIAMNIYGPYAGYDCSQISVYNNIFIGAVVYYDLAITNEGNNIYWAVSNASLVEYDQTDFLTSKMVKGYEGNAYFDTGFFTSTIDRSWLYWDVAEATWHLLTLNSPGHQLLLDFNLRDGVDAVNFSDTSQDPTDSLGSLDINGYYINQDGAVRNLVNYNAGAYNGIAVTPPSVQIKYVMVLK